jgi:hypothetical protein
MNNDTNAITPDANIILAIVVLDNDDDIKAYKLHTTANTTITTMIVLNVFIMIIYLVV